MVSRIEQKDGTMQIECVTTTAAAQVMLALIAQRLQPGKDFYVDGPNLPDPPACFTLYVNLPYTVLSQLRTILDTIITDERNN